MTTTITLNDIIIEKRKQLTELMDKKSLAELEQEAKKAPSTRPFVESLRNRAEKGLCALIAEVKKKSPSKGIIRPNFNPGEIAKDYELGMATCISVLTEETFFEGSNDDLITVKSKCNLPVLRKDFTLDPYHIFEARAIGADCILLIMSCLSTEQAKELESIAMELGMGVLLEVHNRDELIRAFQLKSRMLGINNRDLNTFVTDISTTLEIAPIVPDCYLVVSESGIRSPEDIRTLGNKNVKCFLVGETLMRQNNLRDATKQLACALDHEDV